MVVSTAGIFSATVKPLATNWFLTWATTSPTLRTISSPWVAGRPTGPPRECGVQLLAQFRGGLGPEGGELVGLDDGVDLVADKTLDAAVERPGQRLQCGLLPGLRSRFSVRVPMASWVSAGRSMALLISVVTRVLMASWMAGSLAGAPPWRRNGRCLSPRLWPTPQPRTAAPECRRR